jgi:hypothetical protein
MDKPTGTTEHVDDNALRDSDSETPRQSREQDVGIKEETSGWGPPPLVAKMSPEERIAAEKKLKRKIDFRLLPVIVVMYVLSTFFGGSETKGRLS